MTGSLEQKVFFSRAQRRLMERGIPILMYHKIGRAPRATRDPFLYTAPETFEAQLSQLRAQGFRAVRLDDMWHSGEAERRAVVTFDDGFQNVFERALEILARQKTFAIQFIVSGAIGKENHWETATGEISEPLMDAAQIKEWIAAGYEIGSHSVTHRNLKKLSTAEAREEIFASKKMLEDQFQIPIRHFCYPFGGFNPAVRALVAEAGYATGCSVEFGVNDAQADRFGLRRIIPLSRGELMRKVLHRLAQKVGRR